MFSTRIILQNNTIIRKMLSTISHQRDDAMTMFRCALDAVSPTKMIQSAVSKDGNSHSLRIRGESFSLKSTRVSLIGFGKAVADMATAAREILAEDLQQGILSAPVGTLATLRMKHSDALEKDPKFRIYEGAENNLPDKNSMIAANEILSLVEKLEKDDLLLVLISGGGSALLPAPIPPVTLQEKLTVTKMLASAGATIQELNVVRTHLSRVKGGKLARAARSAQVVALILSDVIGDHLDVIASGPTFLDNSSSPSDALQIIAKYMINDKIPSSVLTTLQSSLNSLQQTGDSRLSPQRVRNYLIGSNKMALSCALNCGRRLGYNAVVISSGICGEAKNLGEFYARLSHFMIETYHSKLINSGTYEELKVDAVQHGINANELDEIIKLLTQSTTAIKVAIISGGETTVKVTGEGLGGRNQESVLAFSLQCEQMNNGQCDVTFLSAGTDGQDGPTTAAGAVAYKGQLADLSLEKTRGYLSDNDSYTFFKIFKPNDLIVTGVTGTNVMDVHILLVSFH